jgi:NADH-quinone oxidoreductase subunit G
MAKIYIDNEVYEVKDGKNLLEACLSLGFNLPYFCWHPAMHSVGACRQCAVKQFKDEKDTRGKIIMSCMTPVSEGMRISVDDPEAVTFRRSVIEWLMLNHPHDCPVCDEGGECHLQDMTVMTGHNYRATRFPKRTFRNQYLGPFINHEMNRCIACYRCVRFYCEYAQGRDFNVFASHDHVYFGRYEDGVLENEFSGNLTEICPTGVFTDKTMKRHFTRKWDLQTAPSVCVHCGVGCNTLPAERYGTLRRIRSRFNGEINGYFLCDRGRYGYEFVNGARRIVQPFIRLSTHKPPLHERAWEGPARSEDILEFLKAHLYFGAKVIGIGSPRASMEANYALRTLVGADNFYLGISEDDFVLMTEIAGIMRRGPARSPSLHDIRNADAVFVLGEDLTNCAPMTALALRQAVRRKPVDDAVRNLHIPEWQSDSINTAIQNEKGPLFIAAPYQTRLEDIAAHTYIAAPDDLARLGFAVAHELDATAPAVEGLPKELGELSKEIARALQQAQRPLVISGTGCGTVSVIHAAANIARALCSAGRPAQLSFTVPECNSLGLALLGGKSIRDAFRSAREGKADTVIILENDLYRRVDAESLDRFLEGTGHVIAIDHTSGATTAKAEVVLPCGTFAETQGSLINNEGRAQRFFKVFHPFEEVRESWRWIRDLMKEAGRQDAERWGGPDNILADLVDALPEFRPILEIAPPSGFRIHGMRIPRQPLRYSGRTSILADVSVHEPKPPDDPDSPLSFSMEGYSGQPPSSLIPRFWSPGWNSVQALNKFQDEVGGPLRGGDPGRRLLEPSGDAEYFADVPVAFRPRQDELLVICVYHIFGSEELSVLSPGIAELAPKPYLTLNPKYASAVGLTGATDAALSLGNAHYVLPVKLVSSLPDGIAGIPAGMPGLEGVALPSRGKIAPVKKEEGG